MAKLTYFLMLAVIIQLSLVLFTGQYGLETDPTQNSTNATMSITDLILNPQNIMQNPILQYFSSVLFALGLLTIVAGLYLVRNEWIVYAGIAGVFVSFAASFYNFHQYMSSQGIWNGAGPIILSLYMIAILIGFIISVLDWSRGRD